ncbi:MAG: InlB B-repeat-containing protein, partial [Bacilli bacterium]|nr:InlB B-repeat-containing protein [Bacilli bacterium]
LASCGGGEESGGTEPATQYVVTFNLNYDGAPAATTQKVNAGAKAQKPANPSRNGYSFVNWYENAAGTGNAFDFNTPINANKTLYAKWDQNQATTQYTVTFNLNYTGAPAATTAKVDAGGKVTKPTNPTRTGFSFDNWYENAAGTGSAFDFNTAINADKTLYAKWTENGGGSTPTPGAPLPDDHQGTTEKDASWKRTDLYARHTPYDGGESAPAVAPYVTVQDGPDYTGTSMANPPSNATNRFRADSAGYVPIGNTNKNNGGTITYAITSSVAAEVGVYVELSATTSATPAKFDEIFEVYVNSAKVTTSNFTLPTGTTNWGASDKFQFVSYSNLNIGDNTLQIKIIMPSTGNNGANFYGFRLSAQSATIAGKTAS